jgi:hypothetical protein
MGGERRVKKPRIGQMFSYTNSGDTRFVQFLRVRSNGPLVMYECQVYTEDGPPTELVSPKEEDILNGLQAIEIGRVTQARVGIRDVTFEDMDGFAFRKLFREI